MNLKDARKVGSLSALYDDLVEWLEGTFLNPDSAGSKKSRKDYPLVVFNEIAVSNGDGDQQHYGGSIAIPRDIAEKMLAFAKAEVARQLAELGIKTE